MTSERPRGGKRYFGKKNKKAKEFVATVEMNQLQSSTLKRWSETRVIFNQAKAEEYLNKGPESENPLDILKWANDHPFLKVSKMKIPIGIVPEEFEETYLYDIVVAPPKSKGPRVIDDDIYDAFPFIRSFVPRGLCILTTTNSKTKVSESKIIIFAMKKFTGGPGDDDDQEEVDSTETVEQEKTQRYEHYFLEPAANTVHLISTSKENGDASHLGQVRLGSETYLIFGSKNVHLLAKKASDVDKYTEQRFMVARIIAKHMFECIEGLDKAGFAKFLDYMELNSLTATMEFLQLENQHIEYFDFPKSTFRFITFTSNKHLSSLVYDDILASVEVARAAGFETVTVEKYAFSEQDVAYNKIRQGYGKEGAVVYYVNGQGHIIGLVKKKTIWYVVVRSIREKVKAFAKKLTDEDANKSDLKRRTKKRIKETLEQKQRWLGFSDQVLKAWTDLAMSFVDWLVEVVGQPDSAADGIDRMFPKVWNAFLKDRKLSDKVEF